MRKIDWKANWEQHLSAILLLTAGIILSVMMIQFIWIDPPGQGLEMVSQTDLPDRNELSPSSSKLNLNTATLEQLDALPGIGKTIAGRILEYREKHGKFTAVEELLEIDGIGEITFESLASLVEV